jgi:hypothetical protein
MTKEHLVSLAVTYFPILSAAVGGWAVRHWWPAAEARIESEIELDHSDPHVRAIAMEADKWVLEQFPDGGDARYAMAADALILHAKFPGIARPFLVAALTALGTAAKKIATDVEQHEAPKPESHQ